MVLTNIFQKGVAAQGSRLYTTMSENTDFIILKQGNTEVQSKYTKGDLKRASRKLEIAASIGLIIALALSCASGLIFRSHTQIPSRWYQHCR